ncbi:MAG: TrkH family potassium uptake protein [Anaerolineae bacterium]
MSDILGRYLFYFALILLIPCGVSLASAWLSFSSRAQEIQSAFSFFATFLISSGLGIALMRLGEKGRSVLHRKESVLLVVVIWVITVCLSALPFLFSGTLQRPIDALFESMSGLTTTGSTILYPKAYDLSTGQEIPVRATVDNLAASYRFYGTVAPILDETNEVVLREGVEALSRGLLFWRSFLQWLGGMGIIVLFIAVLPALSMGGRFLFEAEASGFRKEALTPRIKQTASLLWKIYFGLTAAQIVLLMAAHPSMPFFDAVTLSFSTLSTGGFSIKNDGISAYGSSGVEWICLFFMIFGSVNFSLYFYVVRGQVFRLYEPEFFTFLGSLAASALLMTALLWQGTLTLGEAFRLGSFQAISAQTSTGFAMATPIPWLSSCQLLLLILTFIGGMAGSTSGGIKIARHLIAYHVIVDKIESLFRPSRVRFLKIGEQQISDKTALTTLTFFCVLLFFIVIGTFLLVIDGIDSLTAFQTIVSMTNNAGLSLGGSDLKDSYAFLSSFSKSVCIIWMMLGRLEFFALLVLLLPSFWRSK